MCLPAIFHPSKGGEIKDERNMAVVPKMFLSGLMSNDQHIILLSWINLAWNKNSGPADSIPIGLIN